MAQDPERTAAARQACGDDEMCLFDYLAISPELGAMTMEAGNTFDDNLANLGIDLSLATLFVLFTEFAAVNRSVLYQGGFYLYVLDNEWQEGINTNL